MAADTRSEGADLFICTVVSITVWVWYAFGGGTKILISGRLQRSRFLLFGALVEVGSTESIY